MVDVIRGRLHQVLLAMERASADALQAFQKHLAQEGEITAAYYGLSTIALRPSLVLGEKTLFI